MKGYLQIFIATCLLLLLIEITPEISYISGPLT